MGYFGDLFKTSLSPSMEVHHLHEFSMVPLFLLNSQQEVLVVPMPCQDPAAKRHRLDGIETETREEGDDHWLRTEAGRWACCIDRPENC